jgi:hypothetical protein
MHFFASALLLIFAGICNAASLMVTESNFSSGQYGYNGSQTTEFSGFLRGSFDSIQTNDLTDLNAMLDYDAIWITLRNQTDTLSAIELANVSSYIENGGKLLLSGEWTPWNIWNQSIISLVDGQVDSATSSNNGPLYSAATHELLTDVDSVYSTSGGIISESGNGTVLFDQAVAAVWGDSVLAVLDTGLFAAQSPYYDGRQFQHNVATWLAGSPVSAPPVVPVPGAIWLFGSALAGLGWLKRKQAISNQ